MHYITQLLDCVICGHASSEHNSSLIMESYSWEILNMWTNEFFYKKMLFIIYFSHVIVYLGEKTHHYTIIQLLSIVSVK